MAPFRFTYEFRAASVELFWRCFFRPEHDARVDARTGVRSRELLEDRDDGGARVRAFRLVPGRQLPAFLRAIVRSELSYVERTAFYPAESRVAYRIVPSALGDRVVIAGDYTVAQTAPGRLLRVFAGEVTAALPVIGRRVERAILDDMAASLQLSGACTQEWLDLGGPA